jgi:serine/threonine-protein phosphatase 2A regulatory subunit A
VRLASNRRFARLFDCSIPCVCPAASTLPAADDAILKVALLIDELKHEDVQLRLNSMRQLPLIGECTFPARPAFAADRSACAAETLGPERARDELMPFLCESVDDDDEVLLAMASCMNHDFIPLVGGAEFAFTMLPVLEQLVTVEELSVRDTAVDSLGSIILKMPADHFDEHILTMYSHLAERDWFTSRIAATGLTAAVYEKAPAGRRSQVLGLYSKLVRDDTPMVRRAAASSLSKLAMAMSHELVEPEALPLVEALSKDEQDSVRLLAAEAYASMAPIISPASRSKVIVPALQRLASDPSWRVRWGFASHAVEVCNSLRGLAADAGAVIAGPSTVQPSPDADDATAVIGEAFASLLADSEPEVRTAAAARVAVIAQRANNAGVTATLMESSRVLATDSNEHVRAALAGSVLGLAASLGEKRAEAELLPVVLELLKDAASQVRLSVIERLEEVNAVVGAQLLSDTLLPAILELAEDPQWRVRQALVGFMPLLARQLGEAVFSSKLTDLCVRWLRDDVASVREDAATTLRLVTDVFGDAWAERAIIPAISTLSEEAGYLLRVTALRAIARMAAAPGTTSPITAAPPLVSPEPSSSSSSGAAAAATSLSGSSSVPKRPGKARSGGVVDLEAHARLVNSALVPLVVKLAKDPIANVRFNAAKAATDVAGAASKAVVDASLRPVLTTLKTSDRDADVQFFADKTLKSLE